MVDGYMASDDEVRVVYRIEKPPGDPRTPDGMELCARVYRAIKQPGETFQTKLALRTEDNEAIAESFLASAGALKAYAAEHEPLPDDVSAGIDAAVAGIMRAIDNLHNPPAPSGMSN